MSDAISRQPARGEPRGQRQLTAAERCTLLLEISRRSRHTLDLGETLDLLLDAVGAVLDYDAAGIFALNEGLYTAGEQPGGVIAAVARRGFVDRPIGEDEMLSAGRGIIGQAIRSGQRVLVPDVRRDPRYVVGRPQTLSEVVVPITVDGRTIAALDVESDHLAAFDERDLELLEFFAEAAALAIEKALLHRQLLDQQLDKEQLDAQLRIASAVQLGLLPQTAPQLIGWDIAGRSLPSLELGGDYFDYLPLADGRLGVAIADVAGKGVPAALTMATFRAFLRARHQVSPTLAATISEVDRLLRESATQRAFVTCFYAVLDPLSGHLTYASCGHPLALLHRANGSVVELANCGPVLGVFEAATPREREVVLAPGDQLLLYTDGLTEAIDPRTGEQLGIQRALAVLDAGRARPAAASIDALIAEVRRWVASPHLADDLTLVVLRREA